MMGEGTVNDEELVEVIGTEQREWCRTHQSFNGECGVFGWHDVEPLEVSRCPDCGRWVTPSLTAGPRGLRHLPSHFISCPLPILGVGMSGKRIVEETACEHGQTNRHWGHFPGRTKPSEVHKGVQAGNEWGWCEGGSRRVLTEGQYVLVEKVGDQPENWRIIDPAGLLAPIVDVLSDHTEGTP